MSLLLALFVLLVGFFAAGPVATESEPAMTAAGVAGPEASGAGPDTAVGDAPFATLTIRNWACPVAYDGANYAQDCQEPVADMEFAITAPADQAQTALTDANGQAAFEKLPAGIYEITGGPPGEFVQNAIACRITDLEGLPLPYFPRDNRAIGVTLVDTDITCDWYSIPEDLRGDA